MKLSGEILEIDKRVHERLSKISNTINNRRKTFGEAFVGAAFERDKTNELKVCYCLVTFQRRRVEPTKKTIYDYGNFILCKKTTEISKAVDLIHLIWEKHIFELDEFQNIPLEISLDEPRFLQSYGQYGPVSSQWPTLHTHGRIDDSTSGKIRHEPLSKKELPLFPSSLEAINVFLDLNLPENYYHLDNRIEIRIPDYRARIKNLRLARDKVSLEVEVGETLQDDLIAKFYCKGEKKNYISKDLALKDKIVSFSLDEEPLLVAAHLLSNVDGDSIDQRKYDYRHPYMEKGVMFEMIEGQLEYMITRGENVNIEFKRELDKDRTRFLESVVAFANTNGGTILLGVDNNCRVTGFKEDESAKIIDLISDNCDPPIKVQIAPDLLILGKPITRVDVPEGDNKPYALKEKGIFVRRGASNRQIKRTELDEIYRLRTQDNNIKY